MDFGLLWLFNDFGLNHQLCDNIRSEFDLLVTNASKRIKINEEKLNKLYPDELARDDNSITTMLMQETAAMVLAIH